MKNKYWILFLLFLIQACSINLYEHKNVVRGEFAKISKYSFYSILLKDNNIVIVLKNIPNLSDTCVGSWQIISNNEILINCQGTTVYEDVLRKALYPSYDIHNDTIKVINKNKIIYKNAIYRKYKRNRN